MAQAPFEAQVFADARAARVAGAKRRAAGDDESGGAAARVALGAIALLYRWAMGAT